MIHFLAKSTVLAVLAALLGLPALSAGAASELTCSTVMMENHPVIAHTILPFFKEWSQRAGGEVNVTYFNPGTLCSSAELFSAGEKGVVNIICAPLGAAPAVFPISMFIDLPLVFDNSRAASLTALHMLRESPRFAEEYKNWKIISISTSSPRQILSVRKPIQKLEDLKGLKVSTSSAQGGEMLAALGAIPVVLPLNDTYLALQRGMVDAAALPIPTFKSTKVTEVAKYITLCNLNPSPTPLMMSKATYDSLSPKAKEELDKLAGEPMTIANSTYSDYFTAVDLDWVVQNHHARLVTLDDAELARWKAAAQSTHKAWEERAARQGVENPGALLAQMLNMADTYNDAQTQKRILEAHKDVLGGLYPPQEVLDVVLK